MTDERLDLVERAGILCGQPPWGHAQSGWACAREVLTKGASLLSPFDLPGAVEDQGDRLGDRPLVEQGCADAAPAVGPYLPEQRCQRRKVPAAVYELEGLSDVGNVTKALSKVESVVVGRDGDARGTTHRAPLAVGDVLCPLVGDVCADDMAARGAEGAAHVQVRPVVVRDAEVLGVTVAKDAACAKPEVEGVDGKELAVKVRPVLA